jgi:hypothetical protein
MEKHWWGLYQEFEEVEEEEDVLPSWYNLPLTEIHPYPKTWVIYQTFVEVEVDEEKELENYPVDLYPYFRNWQVFQDTFQTVDFQPSDPNLFINFDETLVGRVSLGIILNSDLIGTQTLIFYDSGEFVMGGEVGFSVKKILAEISVYDSLHSSPGNVYEIPEEIGVLETESEPENPVLMIIDPVNVAIGVEHDQKNLANFIVDDPLSESKVVVGDGEEDSLSLLVSANGNPSYDKPPGTLIASLSYEIVGTIATITAWSHPNWEDDSPLIKAVETMLQSLPTCVVEVQVEDDPTPFWTSLGFHSAVKGDSVLRHYRN